MSHKISEERALNDFIDDLLEEKEPGAYRSDVVDPEQEKMFETVRAIKRLSKGKRKNFYSTRWFKGVVAVAAAFILAIGLSILEMPGRDQPNIVQAVVRAYEDLQGYRGVFEIRSERNGDVDFFETIQISYEKPGKYHAIHNYSGFELRYISDGNRMVADEIDLVTVENIFPEKELWRYHIGTIIGELLLAEKVEVIDEETLFGRIADVVQYSFPDCGEVHLVWIDRLTNLPLRKILNNPEGRLVVEFKELEIDPDFDRDVFVTEVPEGKEVRVLNRVVDLSEVKSEWPEAERIINAVSDDMKLHKTGLLENDFYKYVLRFQGAEDYDFIDIFYAPYPNELALMPDSKVGTLAGGYVEINMNAWNVFERYIGSRRMARWVTNEMDIFMVSNKSTSFLQGILEEFARDKIEFKTLKEMQELGVDIATEKEGH